jgi:hypothetical protein
LPFKCNLQRYTEDDARVVEERGGALHVGIKLTHNP